MLGLKIENKRALQNVEMTIRVPGIAFAEWGPGDMGMSFGYRNIPSPYPVEMLEARDRVFIACKAAGVAFLEGASPNDVSDSIDQGVRIFSAGSAGEVADAGRSYTNRSMPV